MSLQGIRDFGTFPYAGYPWNEYLLEEFSEEEQEKLVVALEKLMQRAQTAAQESLKGR